MAEEKKTIETTQQKESQGKEKLTELKEQNDGGLYFKETITVRKVED